MQPSTCIYFQLHVLCVHSELHCCMLPQLTDAKAYVQYIAQVVIDSPVYCVCSRSVGLYDMSTASMQQECPERSEEALNKQ